MAVRTLLGMETEYAVSGRARDGAAVDRHRLVESMLILARKAYPHLRDGSGGGLFLTNGARLYIDRGAHPEFATPECEDPREVVHYVRAGEALLLDLAERLKAREPDLAEVNVYRCNVDYGRSGATWGCHESYLHRESPLALPSQLIPHLVTRVIYAGAGGFNPVSPGLEFTLSPRAALISQSSSPDSTSNRGIYHLKNESLSGQGWHRLHVICGESLCSDTAAVLKLGTTALVLAAIETGRRPGDPVRLATPVDALHSIARDASVQADVPLSSGGWLRAVEIQRHYLAEVEVCREAGLLPAWAAPVCALWRETLDAIELGWEALAGTLDWAIKRTLYERWSRDRISWELLPRCGEVLRRLERAAARMLGHEAPATLDAMLSADSPFRREVHRLSPLLAAEALDWRDLRAFLRLRHELFESDLRFGQLGPHGIFEQLDHSGVLRHRLGDSSARAVATTCPPERGRARVRGEWVRRLTAGHDTSRYRCDWSQVWDELTGRRVDLSDPFVATADWHA